MGISFSYVSCIEFDKPRPLLQAIIGQLKVVCSADSLSCYLSLTYDTGLWLCCQSRHPASAASSLQDLGECFVCFLACSILHGRRTKSGLLLSSFS